jgi:hypothetical protein
MSEKSADVRVIGCAAAPIWSMVRMALSEIREKSNAIEEYNLRKKENSDNVECLPLAH